MPLIDCSFDEFAGHVKTKNKEVICYGAGMLPLYVEPLFSRYDLLRHIRLFIDGDPQKEGKIVPFHDRSVKIAPPAHLRTLEAKDQVILITAECYEEIFCSLGRYLDLNQWECYAYPLLNLSYFQSGAAERLIYGSDIRIPKVIHTIWFGGNEKEELHLRCIESWKRHCPHYEIVEWNESNYDVHQNKYTAQAYETGKWAYVSDYARLDILYQYGGIYMDSDVELLKNPDALLTTNAFLCFGEWPAPNSGAGIGCIKGHALIGEMMETRERLDFTRKDGKGDPHTNSNYEMHTLMRHGFQMDFSLQIKEGLALYPPDVIAPVSRTGRDSFLSDRSFGIHYCNNSWRDGNGRTG